MSSTTLAPPTTSSDPLADQSVRSVNPDSGSVAWQLPNGDMHRVDGPAAEHPSDGRMAWWLFGERHRVGGPAVYGPDIAHEWYHHGQKHRDDGPAVIYPNGEHEYYVLGKLHRTNGPAIETPGGSRERRYWAVDDCRVLNPAVLDDLYDSATPEDLATLELVLTTWVPGGPSVADLHQAILSAHA